MEGYLDFSIEDRYKAKDFNKWKNMLDLLDFLKPYINILKDTTDVLGTTVAFYVTAKQVVIWLQNLKHKLTFITLDDAAKKLYSKTRLADHIQNSWENVGVTRDQTTKEQLLSLIKDNKLTCYGIRGLRGEKISNKLEVIPNSMIPPNNGNKWSGLLNLILSLGDDLQYTDISLKRREFNKALKKELVFKLKLG